MHKVKFYKEVTVKQITDHRKTTTQDIKYCYIYPILFFFNFRNCKAMI